MTISPNGAREGQKPILSSHRRRKVKIDPLSQKIYLKLAPPSLADNRADRERLMDALRPKFGRVLIAPEHLRSLPETLRRAEWQVTVTLGHFEDTWHIVDMEEGNTEGSHYGLAVDVGTTTVVAYLVNLQNGSVMDVAADYNGQISLGEDILTRIMLGSEPEGLIKLQSTVIKTLNKLAGELAQAAGIYARNITAASLAGNTTMIHLLTGLDPARICRSPYIPAANRPGCLTARETGLQINPGAAVYILPGVGSYVGGDIVAGILASGMHKHSEISLFIDIGTNGEMVLGNRQWLTACAGAAGPALEGGVAGSGIRAMPGAIDRVHIDPAGKVTYSTIGGEKPRGICGSGLVDSVAEFLLNGIIDRSGRFRSQNGGFTLVSAGDSATGREISLTQTDINNLLRTKGAVNAALEYLLESVGLPFSAIERFYAAGAFGQYLPVESAVTIGLYPDLDRERMVRLGNSSGEGARLVLVSHRKRKEAEDIARKITYFELNASDVFMQKFVGSRFLPHTDLSLYPSVRKKLKERGLIK